MAHLATPFTLPIDSARRILRMVTNHAASDGHIDDSERALIDAVRDHGEGLVHRANLYQLSRHLERMEQPTGYTHRLAEAAGLGITHLDDYREEPMPANVIAIHKPQGAA